MNTFILDILFKVFTIIINSNFHWLKFSLLKLIYIFTWMNCIILCWTEDARHKRLETVNSISVKFKSRQFIYGVGTQHSGILGGVVHERWMHSGIFEMFYFLVRVIVACVCALCENLSSCNLEICVFFLSIFSI